jgi:hypothetical protein
MPADDRLRSDDRNRAEDGRAAAIEPNHQTAVGIVELRSLRRLPAQYVDLLAQDKIFRFQPRSRLEKRRQDTENQLEQLDHREARLLRVCFASSRIEFSVRTVVKVAVVVGVSTALSIATASAPASSAALSRPVSAAISDAARLGREKYSVGFLNAAPIPANHRLIFSTMRLMVRTTPLAFGHGCSAIA